MKNKLRFLYSMKLAIIILSILVAVCVLGSLIPQGKVDTYYFNAYGEQIGSIIKMLGIDDVFHCWWVIVLAAVLSLNLILCSIIRFPVILHQFKDGYTADRIHKIQPFRIETKLKLQPELMKKLHFFHTQSIEKGWYGVKGKSGIWGSWLCHLSLLMILGGYSIGQLMSVDTSVYGIAGQTKTVEGTPESIQVAIEDFEIRLREDHTVEQYIATLTIENEAQEVITGTSQVNAPLDAFGYRFYQNSTGWANTLSVYYKEELIFEDVLCAGESYTLDDLPLTFILAQFYPDFAIVDGQPVTLTPYLMNPTSIFALYYEGNLIDMNSVGMEQAIQVDDYVFVLHHPTQYTLIQVLYDPTMEFVLLGALVMLISLFLAFYVRCEECWIVEENGKVVIYGYAQRGALLYEKSLRDKIKRLEDSKK